MINLTIIDMIVWIIVGILVGISFYQDNKNFKKYLNATDYMFIKNSIKLTHILYWLAYITVIINIVGRLLIGLGV